MNKYWRNFFQQDSEQKKESGVYRRLNVLEENSGREITVKGKVLINFSSNDYLGLAHDPRILKAGYDAAAKFGNGSGASRLITGNYKYFSEVEKMLSEWVGKERCLVYNSGYQANIGLLSGLADRNSIIFTDKYNHASIYDGAILSRAKISRFPHKNTQELKRLIKIHKNIEKRILITDSVFSMDGDMAPLLDMIELSEEYGILTIVDEAHSFGIFGNKGNGLVNQLGLGNRVDIIMGTLGKSFGVFGAFVLADNNLIDYLVNNSRSFIFSTALPPFVVGAVIESLRIIKEEDRGKKTLNMAEELRKLLNCEGIDTGDSSSQVIPVIVKENKRALNLMDYLLDKGYYAPAIRPPTIPVGTSRIRLSVSYYHTEEDISGIFESIKAWFKKERNG